MKERLKALRLTLNLSQEEFGNKIGIKSRAHISSLEKGTRNITDRIVNDICNTYGVNEEWLRYGTGKMLIEPSFFSLDEYAKSNHLTESEINLIRGFMELDPQIRSALYNIFNKAFSTNTSEELSASAYDDIDIEKELDRYRHELILQKKESKVSHTIECIEEKKA